MQRDLSLLLSYTKKEGSCLIWTRCLNTDGYPRGVIDGNNNTKIHRVVWELANSQNIPAGKCIRHTCDNPKCINPEHLLIGTPKENGQDKVDRDRQPRVVTKEVVFFVNRVAEQLPDLSRKEIAQLVGVDPRRVSDILIGRYCSATGKFLGHGIRRF